MTPEEFYDDQFLRTLLFVTRVSESAVRKHFDASDICDYTIFFREFAEKFAPSLSDALTEIFYGLDARKPRLMFPRTGTALVTVWDSRADVNPKTGQPASVVNIGLRDGMVLEPSTPRPVELYEYLRGWSASLVSAGLRFKVLKVTQLLETRDKEGLLML